MNSTTGDDGGGPLPGTTGTIDLTTPGPQPIDITGQVHHLPCCVKFTGATDVSHYFKPKPTGVEMEGVRVEEAYFRGRKLLGTTIELPEGYSGFVLGKKNPAKDNVKKNTSKGKSSITLDKNSNNWEMLAKSQKITVWNNESPPSQDDAFLRTFHWFAVSKALHEPLTVEDLASVSITQGQN
ncbi:hypothetical protein Droror1_Dr00007953 [Drosera rotundifolia]